MAERIIADYYGVELNPRTTNHSTFLQEAVKAYDIEAVCDRLGMPSVEDAWTYNSKRVYVQNRLPGVSAAELPQIAGRVIEEFDNPKFE